MGNFKEAKKYHFIYKTTNLLNGKYYIGMHSTNNLKDGYLGSGRYLTSSIRKYGKENFKSEILEYLQNVELLKIREKQLVNKTVLSDELCMNLMEGGKGGFISDEQQRRRSIAAGKATASRLKTDIVFYKEHCERQKIRFEQLWKEGKLVRPDWTGRKHSPETLQKMKGHKRQSGEKNVNFGKPRSEDTKNKIKESLRQRSKNITHNLKNTMWINNGTINKMINKDLSLPDGWHKGIVNRKKYTEV